jgi:ribosomal protein L6P/L9E
MYSYRVFEELRKELKLELTEEYNESMKYTGTTVFHMKCIIEGCNKNITIQFIALLRNKRPCCDYHRRLENGKKTSKKLSEKNKSIYDENRKKLYSLFKEMDVELIGDYSNIDNTNHSLT